MARFKSFMPTLLRKPRRTRPPSEGYDDDDHDGVVSDGEEEMHEHRPVPVIRKPTTKPEKGRAKLNIGQLQDELDVREAEIKELIQEKNELRKQLDEFEQQLEIGHHDHQKLSDRLQKEVDAHEQTRQLLSSRTSSSGKGGGPQAFGPIPDALTKADVVGMIEGLNQDVMQAASYIADAFDFEKADEGERGSDEVREARSEASRILGKRFVELLRSTDHKGDPSMVQIALQASILSCCRRIVAARHFDRSRYGSLLSEMCRGISDSEDQAVSGRWRAMTMSHLRRVFTAWKREPEEDFIPDIISYIVDVILVAGVQKKRKDVADTVTQSFRDKLSNIKQRTLRLNKAVVEDVVSGDIEAIYHHPRAEYDPATMDNAHAVASHENEEIADEILCTIDLGLRQYVRLPSDGEADWMKTILLKAKVVLPDGVSRMRESRERERRYDARLTTLSLQAEHAAALYSSDS